MLVRDENQSHGIPTKEVVHPRLDLAHTHAHTCRIYAHMHSHTYTHVCTYVHTYIALPYVGTPRSHTYVHARNCLSCTHMCTYIHMCMYTCTIPSHMCTHVCIQKCFHTSAHMLPLPSSRHNPSHHVHSSSTHCLPLPPAHGLSVLPERDSVCHFPHAPRALPLFLPQELQAKLLQVPAFSRVLTAGRVSPCPSERQSRGWQTGLSLCVPQQQNWKDGWAL
jgi:hypothetical protein